MKVIRNRLLYNFYQVSHGNFIHTWSQRLLISFVLPSFRFIFLKLNRNAKDLILRHSVMEMDEFNLFMSDIDVTIISESREDIMNLIDSYNLFKIIFPLLGELEIHTLQEIEKLKKLEREGFSEIWKTIFSIRKVEWQREKLVGQLDPYEISKTKRGIAKTLLKLKSNLDIVNLDQLEVYFPSSDVVFDYPIYSAYLGANIGLKANSLSVYFSSIKKLSSFYQSLPGSECKDPIVQKCDLRHYLINKEMISARSRYHLVKYNNIPQEAENLQNWILKLQDSL